MRSLQYHESKQRGSPDFPLDYHDIDQRHARYEMPYHWHEEFEILQVRSGTFFLTLDDVPYTLRAGDVAFIAAGKMCIRDRRRALGRARDDGKSRRIGGQLVEQRVLTAAAYDVNRRKRAAGELLQIPNGAGIAYGQGVVDTVEQLRVVFRPVSYTHLDVYKRQGPMSVTLPSILISASSRKSQ